MKILTFEKRTVKRLKTESRFRLRKEKVKIMEHVNCKAGSTKNN